MAATDETLDGLNEVRGRQKPDDVGLGEWIWGALQGDFNTERSNGQIGFDMVVSLIPIVDTLCDVRDLCANIRQYRKDPTNKITLFFIATTVVGFIPELGTVVKSVLRLVWTYLKPLVKHADDLTNSSKLALAANRACDSALPKITEYLQHNRVAKWATDGKLPDIYQFIARTTRETADKINPAILSRLLNDKFDDLKALLQKIRPIVPSTIREHVDDLLKFLEAKRHAMSGAIQEFAQPVRTVLKVVAKQLDDKAWQVTTLRTNRGWIAPISESGSAKLINANPPKWAKKPNPANRTDGELNHMSMEKKTMRNLQLEAAIWYLFTSSEFFEDAARECEETMGWFGTLAISRQVANFGRNNQIFDEFKQRARDFRRAAELARFGDYQLAWDTASCISGDARGMLEQPLHSWMTEAEYEELNGVRISRLLAYAGLIESALNNAMTGSESFLDPDLDCPDRGDDDDGFPGEAIVNWYNNYVNWSKGPLFSKLTEPLQVYLVDTSVACHTGDEVPWTGVWYPSTGLEKYSLTFAIKGLRMQPAYRVVKTTEELRTEDYMFPPPETVAIATTWHPVIHTGRQAEMNEELWAKAGACCPKPGIWQPTDPGATQRTYQAGEAMANLGSPFGLTVWRWVADR